MNTNLVEELQPLLRGRALGPDHPDFARSHQGFNLAEEHRPDVVVCAASADDVSAAIQFAASHELPVRVQATGHGIGIPMTGGILISTAAMDDVRVDPAERTATVGAGARWQSVINAAAPHGLATLCGSSPTVGVVGYTLGGGMGPMARTFGFASDRVRRIKLVTATGETLNITPEHEPELFWALRGGNPDIGGVTELEFDLVELPTYYGGAISYPGAAADTVLHKFAQWAPTMPESVSTSIALLRLPDLPMVPEPLRGKLSLQLRYVHVGDPAEGKRLLAPMRAVTEPIIDLVDVTPAAAIASVHQDPTDPMPARDEGMILSEFSDDAVNALLAVAGPDVDVPLIIAEVRLMGGALGRAGKYDSAVGGREGAFNLGVIEPYPPPLRGQSTHAAVR